MTTQVFVLFVFGVVLAVYLGVAIRTWYRLRGARVVVCPETHKPAGVKVDVGHAVATAVWEKADVTLAACSRWPDRQDCEQPCVAQIEAAPGETRTKTIAAHFFENRRCAICQRRIDPPNAATLQPGFLDPVSHRVRAWDDVPAADLPDALEHERPLCSNCTLAESFRQKFPEEIVDRAPRPGSVPPR